MTRAPEFRIRVLLVRRPRTRVLRDRRRRMKFVLVNGRTPRTQSVCALCCEAIGESYLRDITAQLAYCDHKCYVDHRKAPVLEPGSDIEVPVVSKFRCT